MTTGPSYERVFDRLHAAFPQWDELADVSVSRLSGIIGEAGLVNQKAPRFIEIACRLRQEFGVVTLDPLLSLPDGEVEVFLTSLPGVGTKTAKCVMMYAMSRSVLPIDTHVARVARRLGLIPDGTPRAKLHDVLERVVAPPVQIRLPCQHDRSWTGSLQGPWAKMLRVPYPDTVSLWEVNSPRTSPSAC